MQFHNLVRKTPNKKSMSVGRGGKRGKTSGRGAKGQNARAGRKKRPELRDFIKRIPKLRGRGINGLRSIVAKPFTVSLGQIEKQLTGTSVKPQTLLQAGLILKVGGLLPVVKILADGDLTKKITVSGCLVSASAKAKIEKAGGMVHA